MLTRLLLITLQPLCLMGCAVRTSKPALQSVWLQPTTIEGRYASLNALMADKASTTGDLLDFAGNAEDAVLRCNADKTSATKETP